LPTTAHGAKNNYASYELDEFSIYHILEALVEMKLLEVAVGDDGIATIGDGDS
jgi:hypothetical protein